MGQNLNPSLCSRKRSAHTRVTDTGSSSDGPGFQGLETGSRVSPAPPGCGGLFPSGKFLFLRRAWAEWPERPGQRRYRLPTPVFLGFPCGSAGKESTCNEGDLGLIPGLRISPERRHGKPLQYSCLEDPRGQRSLVDYSPWNSPGQNTGVGCHASIQGIFPTQGSIPGLPYCQRILYQLSHKRSPKILEWVAYPFSRESS